MLASLIELYLLPSVAILKELGCLINLQVPFLDVCNTLLHPVLPLTPADYEEFGYPFEVEDFLAIRKYSPYDNIQKDVPYPAVLVTSSLNTRCFLGTEFSGRLLLLANITTLL